MPRGSNHRTELLTSACAAGSSNLSPSPTRQKAAIVCAASLVRDVCEVCGITALDMLAQRMRCPRDQDVDQDVDQGGDASQIATPGACAGIGTNQEREVERP